MNAPGGTPNEGQAVFFWDGERLWIGTWEFEGCKAEPCAADGDGWHATRSCHVPDFCRFRDEWVDDDVEWDDDYTPTHWLPLPLPPKAEEGKMTDDLTERALEVCEFIVEKHRIFFSNDRWFCPLCGNNGLDAIGFVHEPDCPVSKARTIIAEMEGENQSERT